MPPSLEKRRSHRIHVFFEAGLFFKSLNAALEVAGGAALLFISKASIVALVAALTQDELAEDPRDFLANLVLHSAKTLPIDAQWYAAIYLLSHGIIKALLLVALYKKKLWAYPLSMGVFALFVVYQTYQYFAYSHALALMALNAFDIAIIWLIWEEHRYLRALAKPSGV